MQLIVTNLYRNRCAFGDLCIGYLITIFATKTFSDCITFVSIIIATALITGLEYHLAAVLAKKDFPEGIEVHSSELEKRRVTLTATDKEFNEMLTEVGVLDRQDQTESEV